MVESKDILNFVFELGQLKLLKRQGSYHANIKDPESVAEHSLRAAQIALILAKMENHPEPYKIVTMTVFHDIAETRVGDIHRIAARYVKADEEQAVKDQTERIGDIGKNILELWKESEDKITEASKIAKDADLLELCITCKEYIELGHTMMEEWIKNATKGLSTNSGKELANILMTVNSKDWWQFLKKIN